MRAWLSMLTLIAVAVVACETEPATDETAGEAAEDTEAVDAAAVEDSIRAVNARFERAVLAGDSTAVADLYTDDAVLMAPGTPRVRGRTGIRSAFARMAPGMREFELETDRVEVAGSGDLAWEEGSYGLALETPDGDTIRDVGKYLVVWEKVDGAWHLAADAFNSDLPPGGAPAEAPADTTAGADATS